MKVKAYTVVERAVEEGIADGITRLFKHDGRPLGEDELRVTAGWLEEAVLNRLCEVIEFSDEDLGVSRDEAP